MLPEAELSNLSAGATAVASGRPPQRKHRRTTSLVGEQFDRTADAMLHFGSLDFSKTLKSELATEAALVQGVIDSRLLCQSESMEKIQIIESIEPDFKTPKIQLSKSFYPLLNRLSVAAPEPFNHFSTARCFLTNSAEKERQSRHQPGNQPLCSIPEQSELASSIFNSIHRHSNPEVQKMLSPSGRRGEEGDASVSLVNSKPVSPRKLERVNNSLDSLSLERCSVMCKVTSTNPPVPVLEIAFRKADATDDTERQQVGREDSEAKRSKKAEVPKKVLGRNVNFSGRFEASRPKDTVQIDELQEFRQPKRSDRSHAIHSPNGLQIDLSRRKDSQSKTNKKPKEEPKNLRASERLLRMRGFLSDLRHDGPRHAGGSPNAEMNRTAKEPSGIFSTLLKRDPQNGKVRTEQLIHLVKTVKSDDRPDVIQKLFKFRIESSKIVRKREPKRDNFMRFKQKLKTLNFIPAVDIDKRIRSAQVQAPGLSHRQSIRPTINFDPSIKKSFLNRQNQFKAKVAVPDANDRLSTSFSEKQRVFKAETPVCLHKISQRLSSVKGSSKVFGQFRIKTESEASHKKPIGQSKGKQTAMMFRGQNTDTKTKNLNIYFPVHEPSSDLSQTEEEKGLPKLRVTKESSAKQIWQNPKPAVKTASKRPLNGLFGKTKSMSSACLSNIGKSRQRNTLGVNSSQNLAEKGELLSREFLLAARKRLLFLGSFERNVDFAEKRMMSASKVRQRVERPLRRPSSDASGKGGGARDRLD